MRKAEIISRILKELGLLEPETDPVFSGQEGEEEDEEAECILAALNDKLPEGEIKTCEDFRHLNVECCETCHGHYAHYEMQVIKLPDGSPAWVCGPIRRAIYPEELRKLQEWSRNSAEGKLLREIFDENDTK
jgi:hypothetical protein